MADPCGRDTVRSAVAGAQCWAFYTPHGLAVVAVRITGPRAWITAAASRTVQAMASPVLTMIEAQAAGQGAQYIGFQTVRRGLLRLARARGYQVRPAGAGWYARKELADA